MPNRLARETSPYLLQHAENPVDWFPWGPDALEKAKREDKPILLSIGYAACHWCHVMAHESFEDEETARLMNEKFVNIKVDREERPDLDGIYMQAVQAMSGHGGWPMTMFLLRDWKRTGTSEALDIVVNSFRKMARGGIYDQIGGGFARYSVDATWLVPHFEKMLYDNALLARLGAHLWQATRDEEVRRVVVETVEWLDREMTSPEGGFYSSLDADSEGHEGKFYVWSEEEFDALLGADARAFKTYYGVVRDGNFEGKSILYVPLDPAAAAARAGIDVDLLEQILARARRILLETRSRRVWPARDEKILAAWNGLALRGVATAARALERADFASLAISNSE